MEQMKNKTKKGDGGMSWEKVKFSDIFNFENKSKNKAGDGLIEGKYPFYTSSAILSKYLNQFSHEKTSLIFGTGGNASIHFCEKPFSVSTDCLVAVSKDKISCYPKFVYYYLSGNINILEEGFKGAGLKHISKSFINDIEIPLPPLPIQQRIAEILDAADALRRKDHELLRKYDELAQAIFIDMFGDPVKNEKGYAKIKLGECLENIQIGPFGTQLHESDYIKNGIPLINPMHIGDLKIKPNHNYSISEEKYLELPQYHLKVDDVILGRRGEMGRCAIVTKEQGKCLCGTGSLFLTVKKELLDPLFLVYVLSRKTTKIALENVSAGTTMANLNKNIITDFEIILPNIAKQKDFVNAIKMSEQSIEFTYQLLNKSNHIFDSLLEQAFNGDLVK
jgi:type I restriction enzyme S subunit